MSTILFSVIRVCSVECLSVEYQFVEGHSTECQSVKCICLWQRYQRYNVGLGSFCWVQATAICDPNFNNTKPGQSFQL